MTHDDARVRELAAAYTAAWNSGAPDAVAYFWTFTGTHAATGMALRVVGWEEWDLNAQYQIAASRGWFDAGDYERQIAAGGGF